MSRPNRGRTKRRPPWWVLYPDRYLELMSALRTQQQLRLSEIDGRKIVRGRYNVMVDGKRFDSFRVRIEVPRDYPQALPVLFLTDDRVPRIPDRHVNSANGDTCLYVPAEWMVKRPDDHFDTWLRLPVRNYFLAQRYYEEHGRFPPDGERRHYDEGMLDAYAELLGTSRNLKKMHYLLRILSHKNSKGHWLCPCGSKRKVRKCCSVAIQEKRVSVDRKIALKMLQDVSALIEPKIREKYHHPCE